MQPTKEKKPADAARGNGKGKYPGSSKLPPSNEELGEGNRTAAKRYNAGVKETVETKDIDKLAHEAEEALEGPEGDELREAEKRAKKGPLTS
jgi:hypothetical protein